MIAIGGAEMLAVIARECERAGGKVKWAVRHEIAASVVSEVLKGKRDIPESMANACGFLRAVVFKPISQTCEHERRAA